MQNIKSAIQAAQEIANNEALPVYLRQNGSEIALTKDHKANAVMMKVRPQDGVTIKSKKRISKIYNIKDLAIAEQVAISLSLGMLKPNNYTGDKQYRRVCIDRIDNGNIKIRCGSRKPATIKMFYNGYLSDRRLK